MASKVSRTVGSTEYRNRVRGLLSEARQHGFGIDDQTRRRRAKHAMRSIILEARRTLAPDRYVDHLNWLHRQVAGAGSSDASSIGQGLLYRNVPTQPVDLEIEVRWVAARLLAAAGTVRAHLEFRQALAHQVLSGCADEALRTCDAIEAEIGDSHWLIANRLYILQKFKGIDAQKAYLNLLRSGAGRCVSTAYAYLVSIRNEPSVSMQWFRNDVRKRLFSRKHPEHKTYMHFCLIGEIPNGASGIADILRIEQAHSDVDLYETLVTLLQRAHDWSFDPKVHAALLSCIEKLSASIPDARLVKLKIAFGCCSFGAASSLPRSDESALVSICSGQSMAAPEQASEMLTEDPASAMWSMLERQLHAPSEAAPSAKDSPSEEIFHLLGLLCVRGQDFERAHEELEKIARNLGGLAVGPFLAGLVDALKEPTAINLAKRLSSCSLTTPTWGVLDRMFVQARRAFELPEPANEAETLASAALGATDIQAAERTPSGEVSRMVKCAKTGNPEDAYDSVDIMLGSDKSLIRNWGRVIALELYTLGGDLGRSLSLIGHLEARDEVIGADLPIAYALGGLKKAHLKQYGADIRAPIAINALLRAGNDEDTQSLQRKAFNHFMASIDCNLPSAIPISLIEQNLPEYAYFLQEVCVPHVMDMNRTFSSTNALLVERRNICALLRNLNPVNQESYDEEIVSITHTLSIWEGLKLVDGSRIHVDEEAFSRAVRSELEGSFNRYSSLVKSGVGVAEDFDIVLRNIVQQDGYAEGLTIPKNEADELLATMVFRMKEMFLSNAIYGLDGYVSKRIRHGSLVGHLRGPVERHKLITQRDKSGVAYESNYHWMQRFSAVDAGAKQRLERAFGEFSRAFDRELLLLKDERLQIRQKHSNGVFDIPVGGMAMHVIRSSIKGDASFEGLARAVLVSFWTLLAPALKQAQELVRDKFQGHVAELFNRLQAAASSCVRSDLSYGELVNAIRLAHEETKVQIATVSGWFDRAGMHDYSRRYSLDDAIDIGVESARSAYPEFRPYVLKQCDSVLMPSPSVQLIADVLLIALGNICMHSGLGNDPSVEIESGIDEENEIVSFIIKNPISGGVNVAVAESTLENIRGRIARREFEPYVGSEGNSGLLKLAAMVYQSQQGVMSFGFEGGKFVLRFSMSFILKVAPNRESAG